MNVIGINGKRLKFHFVELLRFIMCIWVMTEHLGIKFSGQGNLELNFAGISIYCFMIISGFFSAQNPNPKRAIHTLVLMFVAFILIFFLMGIFYLAFSNHAKLNDVNDIHTLIGAGYFLTFYIVICAFSSLIVRFIKAGNKGLIFIILISSILLSNGVIIDTFFYRVTFFSEGSERREFHFLVAFMIGCGIKFYVKIDNKKLFYICLAILPLSFAIGVLRINMNIFFKNNGITGFLGRFGSFDPNFFTINSLIVSFCLLIVFLNLKIDNTGFKYVCLYLGQMAMVVYMIHQSLFYVAVNTVKIDTTGKVIIVYLITIGVSTILAPIINFLTNKLYSLSCKTSVQVSSNKN